MTRARLIIPLFLLTTACARHTATPQDPQPKAFGAALTLISGDKQIAGVGSQLDQPVVIQVNDAKGSPVPGDLVRFSGSTGVTFSPPSGLTGPDGQFTTNVTLGSIHGRYQIAASTLVSTGKTATLTFDEVALGYQEMLGRQLSETHCVRCHESESTPERVSNHDNLTAAPHSFSDGSVLNKMSDSDLAAIISHGGPALGKSAESPPYGNTLSKAEIDALIAFIRAVADPPYRPQGIFPAAN